MSAGSAVINESSRVGVSAPAVLKRINRKLARKSQKLRTYRTCRNGFRPFYLFDLDRNITITEHVDLEQFARDLGVLAGDEVIGLGPVLRHASSHVGVPSASAGAVRMRPFRLRIFPPPEDE